MLFYRLSARKGNGISKKMFEKKGRDNMKKFQTALLACTMIFGTASIPAFAETTVKLPTATVTKLEAEKINPELTFALNFVADEVTEEQLETYGKWNADFVLTLNKDVTFNANGNADGYLAGQYDAYGEDWLSVPFGDVELKANSSLKIMEYASEAYNKPEFKLTYNDVYEYVKNFDCGVFFSDDFIASNPDLEVTLELRMYNPENASESYAIGDTYTFKVWETDTDAGYYVDGDKNYGMIRYLFGTEVKDTITEYGIKYIKGSNITASVFENNGKKVSGTGDVNAFYGDIVGIEKDSDDTYYAIGYVVADGKTYWSEVVECSPKWTRDYTGSVGGAN